MKSTEAGSPRCGANLYPRKPVSGEPKLGNGTPLVLQPDLLELSIVRALRLCDSEAALELIESGQIAWAFDLSAGQCKTREIRVWRKCITNPSEAAAASLEEVLAEVVGGIPTNPAIRAANIERRWMISTQTVRRLRLGGMIAAQLAGHALWITRQSLRDFLKSRVVR